MTIEIGRKIIVIWIAFGFLLPVGFLGVANAQSDGSSVETNYNSTYKLDVADVTRPVAVDSEHHLYHPGETVEVRGSVWSEVIDRVESLNVIKVEIKDGGGDVVAMSDANLDRETGAYTTSLKLPDNISGGTYSVESRVELEADALGIVEAVTSASLQ